MFDSFPLFDVASHKRLNRSNFLNSLRNLTSSNLDTGSSDLIYYFFLIMCVVSIALTLLFWFCEFGAPSVYRFLKSLRKRLLEVVTGWKENIFKVKLFFMKNKHPKLDQENSVGMNAENSVGATSRKDDTLVPGSKAKTFHSFEILESDPAPDYYP